MRMTPSTTWALTLPRTVAILLSWAEDGLVRLTDVQGTARMDADRQRQRNAKQSILNMSKRRRKGRQGEKQVHSCPLLPLEHIEQAQRDGEGCGGGSKSVDKGVQSQCH